MVTRLEKNRFYISKNSPDIKIKVLFVYLHGEEFTRFKGEVYHARLDYLYEKRTFLVRNEIIKTFWEMHDNKNYREIEE